MKSKPGLLVFAAAAALTALGAWLWLRNGVPVWLESAIAFCT